MEGERLRVSGVGAVMGSKRLKAIAVHGKGKVSVADEEKLDSLRKKFIGEFRGMQAFPEILSKYGTCGLTGALTLGGATPIKNWLYAGKEAFPSFEKIADGDAVIKYQTRKICMRGLSNCMRRYIRGKGWALSGVRGA